MTNIAALDELIKAVKAGTMESPPIGKVFGFTRLTPMASKAYHGSLDAAKALHDSLVPEWALERLTMWPGTNGGCSAVLWGTHEQGSERWHSFNDGRVEASAADPARAWLLAILLAYRVKIGGAA